VVAQSLFYFVESNWYDQPTADSTSLSGTGIYRGWSSWLAGEARVDQPL